jgi:DNA invertase Pin-like site-specific DNA recombinase
LPSGVVVLPDGNRNASCVAKPPSSVFSALAQFERRLIQERNRAGLAAARARKDGRPRLLASDPKLRPAKKLYADKSPSVDDICQTLKISRRRTIGTWRGSNQDK